MKHFTVIILMAFLPTLFAAEPLPRQIETLVKSVNVYLDRAEQELNSNHENKLSLAKRQLENAQESNDELFGSRYGSKFDHQHPDVLNFQNRMIKLGEQLNGNSSNVTHTDKKPSSEIDKMIKSTDSNFTAVNYELKKIYKNLATITSINQSAVASGPAFENSGLDSNRALKKANEIYTSMMDRFGGSINTQSQAFKALNTAMQDGTKLSQLASASVKNFQLMKSDKDNQQKQTAMDQKLAANKALEKEYAAQHEHQAKVELQSATKARFPVPNDPYENNKLSNLSVQAIKNHYPNHKILRHYLVGPGMIKEQALIEGNALTFGKYNFLNIITATEDSSGIVRVYFLELAQAFQSDGSWAAPVVRGSYDSSFMLLKENVLK